MWLRRQPVPPAEAPAVVLPRKAKVHAEQRRLREGNAVAGEGIFNVHEQERAHDAHDATGAP